MNHNKKWKEGKEKREIGYMYLFNDENILNHNKKWKEGNGKKENRLYLFNDENILNHNKKWKEGKEIRKIDYICLMMKIY